MQLISGYIDIIMDSRRGADRFDPAEQPAATYQIYNNSPMVSFWSVFFRRTKIQFQSF